MKYDLLVENWKKYITEEDIGTTETTSATEPVDDATKQLSQPTEQDLKNKVISTIVSSVENSIHDAKALADRTNADKPSLRATIIKMVNDVLQETKTKNKSGGDRCTRIAKRKYDVWPSAYASGAVVKCRKGKIWKGISENATDEEIDLALLLEQIEVIDEKWSNKYKRSIDCKHPKGFSQKAHCQGRKKK